MKSNAGGVVLLVVILLAAVGSGDQVTMLAGRPTECTFQGVAGGSFLLLNEKGRLAKEHPSRIGRITLTKPLKVVYQTTDGKKEETALLKGFDKREFLLEKNGKEIRVGAMKMKSLDTIIESTGGSSVGGNAYPIPKIDVDALRAATPNPTDAQQKALARFMAARQAFDAFFMESSALVERMDKASGMQRESLMTTLRQRKNKEQPLKAELVDACSALTEAYPDPTPGSGQMTQPQADDAADHSEREKIKKAVLEW